MCFHCLGPLHTHQMKITFAFLSPERLSSLTEKKECSAFWPPRPPKEAICQAVPEVAQSATGALDPDSGSGCSSSVCSESTILIEKSLAPQPNSPQLLALGNAVSVEVHAMSGQPVLRLTSLPGHVSVEDLLVRITSPHGYSPILLRRHGAHSGDCVLHDLGANLLSLICDDACALQLNVVWQPWLKRGEIVSVVHSFRPRTRCGTVKLDKGLQGTVAKTFDKDVPKGRINETWEEGDALICFGGRNLWVPHLHICNLARA